MKDHEVKVKNKEGQELLVSKAHYEDNKDELTPVDNAKAAKPKAKMEKEPLKNKSDND